MKNNKMKKIISMMVAILFAFSALTVHASATWYEYQWGYTEEEFSSFHGAGSLEADTAYSDIYAGTSLYDPTSYAADVRLGFMVNLDGYDGRSVVAEDEDPNGYADASVSASEVIETDYIITDWSFESSHTAYGKDGKANENFAIGTSS